MRHGQAGRRPLRCQLIRVTCSRPMAPQPPTKDKGGFAPYPPPSSSVPLASPKTNRHGRTKRRPLRCQLIRVTCYRPMAPQPPTKDKGGFAPYPPPSSSVPLASLKQVWTDADGEGQGARGNPWRAFLGFLTPKGSRSVSPGSNDPGGSRDQPDRAGCFGALRAHEGRDAASVVLE